MTDTTQDRLRDGADRFLKWAHKEQYSGPSVLSIPRHPANIDALLETAATHIDAQDAKIKALVEALEELVTCVDDGCYCSEMKMASAIDTANETIAAAKETTA
ncbi:MAG: hypothetical protein V7786_02080 [Sulfitobacter litoralis]|uniref:hypothetical protein n=1 Tax=Sulfitobacter litoralis TaxID=335975 RepID=UPI0030035772